jgi:hypothetical protein
MAAGGYLGAKGVELVPESFSFAANRINPQVESNTEALLNSGVAITMQNRTAANYLETNLPVELMNSKSPLCDRAAVLAALEAIKAPEGPRILRNTEMTARTAESPALGAPLCDREAVLAALEKLSVERGMLKNSAIGRVEESGPANPFFDPQGQSEIFPGPFNYVPHEIPREFPSLKPMMKR